MRVSAVAGCVRFLDKPGPVIGWAWMPIGRAVPVLGADAPSAAAAGDRCFLLRPSPGAVSAIGSAVPVRCDPSIPRTPLGMASGLCRVGATIRSSPSGRCGRRACSVWTASRRRIAQARALTGQGVDHSTMRGGSSPKASPGSWVVSMAPLHARAAPLHHASRVIPGVAPCRDGSGSATAQPCW